MNSSKMTDIFLKARHEVINDQTIELLVKELLENCQQKNLPKLTQQVLVKKLVDEMMRSRPICRPHRGKVLFGVYREIYEQLQQQLINDFLDKLTIKNLPTMEAKSWAISIRNQAIKKILDDTQLKKLGLSAQNYEANSELRQYALAELIEAILWSNRLCHPHREKFLPQFYELIYEEAVIETLTYVCTHIDKYDPERGGRRFMNWVNFRLDKLILEYRRKFNNFKIEQLPSLKDLDNLIQPDEQPLLSEIVRQYIEEDPQKLCQRNHIKNRIDANFQVIALARFAGQSWEEVSQKLDIPIPTLSSFFQRCCNKLAEQFKQDLQN
jgi:DNA-directed RNA polymerase specialized sigma24 family protein